MRRSTLAVIAALGFGLPAAACSGDGVGGGVGGAEPTEVTDVPSVGASSPSAGPDPTGDDAPATSTGGGTTDGSGQPGSTAGGRFTVTPGPPIGQQQTEPDPGEVKLWLSNQSFADDRVGVSIVIDGEPAFDADLEVQGQHNWIPFEVGGLNPGPHTITARSDTGAEFTGSFTLPAGEARWLVLDYWYEPSGAEGRHFVLNEFDHVVAFA